jgi:shikimate dehydrogenase
MFWRLYDDFPFLIVNATPVGMYSKGDVSPWQDRLMLIQAALVYDLVYNPRETALIRQARMAGSRTVSGIGMLVEQAALSFEIWTGCRPLRDLLFAAVEAP